MKTSPTVPPVVITGPIASLQINGNIETTGLVETDPKKDPKNVKERESDHLLTQTFLLCMLDLIFDEMKNLAEDESMTLSLAKQSNFQLSKDLWCVLGFIPALDHHAPTVFNCKKDLNFPQETPPKFMNIQINPTPIIVQNNIPAQPAPIVNQLANLPDESSDVVKAIRKLAKDFVEHKRKQE
jgi:hypothetical protein